MKVLISIIITLLFIACATTTNHQGTSDKPQETYTEGMNEKGEYPLAEIIASALQFLGNALK